MTFPCLLFLEMKKFNLKDEKVKSMTRGTLKLSKNRKKTKSKISKNSKSRIGQKVLKILKGKK